MSKIEGVQRFLIDNIHNLVQMEASSTELNLPQFDLYAYDYLEFANQELTFFTETEHSLHLLIIVKV